MKLIDEYGHILNGTLDMNSVGMIDVHTDHPDPSNATVAISQDGPTVQIHWVGNSWDRVQSLGPILFNQMADKQLLWRLQTRCC